MLTRRLKPRGRLWACAPPAVPPSEIATEPSVLRPEKQRMQAGVSHGGFKWCARRAARHGDLRRSRPGRTPYTSRKRLAARGGSCFYMLRSLRCKCRLTADLIHKTAKIVNSSTSKCAPKKLLHTPSLTNDPIVLTRTKFVLILQRGRRSREFWIGWAEKSLLDVSRKRSQRGGRRTSDLVVVSGHSMICKRLSAAP